MGHDFATLLHLVADANEHRRRQRRALLILVIAVALGLGAIVYVVEELARSQPPKVVIDLAKLPPARPGPAR